MGKGFVRGRESVRRGGVQGTLGGHRVAACGGLTGMAENVERQR